MKTNFKRQQSNKGVALIAVLIAIGVGMVVVIALLASTSLKNKIGGMFRRGAVLQTTAEKGFNLGKRDLLNRGLEENFSTFDEYASQEELLKVGFFPPAPGESRGGIVPRFDILEDNVELQVFYFPNAENGGVGADDHFPKTFTIVSQAKHLSSQEVFTMEGEISLRPENWAEYSFALNHPRVPDGVDELDLAPGSFGGRVHFGLFFDSEGNPDPTKRIKLDGYSYATHLFKELVTFSGGEDRELSPDDDPSTFPFDFAGAQIIFDKGVRSGWPASVPSTAEFNALREVATHEIGDPDHPNADICLKFLDPTTDNNDGKIVQYPCNLSEPNPEEGSLGYHDVFQRYSGELEDVEEGVVTRALDEFDASGIFYVHGNAHVKGLVDGVFTIVTPKQLVLEGDVQYVNQDVEFSDDLVGLLSQGDIVIPYGVPMRPDLNSGAYKQGDPEGRPWNNITNFVVENDRDEDPESEYSNDYHQNPPDGRDIGWKNNVFSLDLDAIMMSVEGGLNVEGINGLDGSSPGKAVIPDVNGDIWSLETTNEDDSYYFQDADGNWTRRADPIYCGAPGWYGYGEDRRCILYKELSRAQSETLSVFGSVILNEYTHTSNRRWLPGCAVHGDAPGGNFCEGNWNEAVYGNSGGYTTGFSRKLINGDPRVSRWQPPGFPDTGVVHVGENWTKQFRGYSTLLEEE